MQVVDAVEVGHKITITISVKEKNTDWLATSGDLSTLPRFQAMAKQLLLRAERSSDNYVLTNVNHESYGAFGPILYTFTWVKNE